MRTICIRAGMHRKLGVMGTPVKGAAAVPVTPDKSQSKSIYEQLGWDDEMDTQQSKNKHRETPHKCMIHEDDMHSGGYASEIRKIRTFYFAVCSFLRSFCLFVLVFGRHLAGVRDGRSTGKYGMFNFSFFQIWIRCIVCL
jgi:hypothetical protein